MLVSIYVFYTHANGAQLKSVIYGICTNTWYIITLLRFYEKYSFSIKQATWKKEIMGKYIYVSLNGMEKGDERDENKLVRRGGCLMTHLCNNSMITCKVH